MLSKFKFKNTALDEKSYFNRNRNVNATGSLFKTKNIDQSISYSIFNIIKNKEYVKYEQITEAKNSDINIPPHLILSNYNHHLDIKERLANHTTEIKLSRWFSINSKIEYQDFIQSIASKNTTKKMII